MLSKPAVSRRARTISKISSKRGRMIPTSMERGTWLGSDPPSSPISGTLMISRSSDGEGMALPYRVFMRSALPSGVERPRAMSLVTWHPPRGTLSV